MTYRAKASGRSARRKAHKEAEFKKAVRFEAALHPKVETRYEPARPPIETWLPLTRDERFARVDVKALMNPDHRQVITLNERPKHRVMAVPVLPDPFEAATINPDVLATTMVRRAEEFQAMEYGYSMGRTHVRWWGWQPRREELQRAELRNVRRAIAYAERVRMFLRDLHGVVGTGNLERLDYPGYFGMREIAEWIVVVLEDLEQIQGLP